jgi:hypothetical protein
MAVTDRRRAYRLNIRMKLHIEVLSGLATPLTEDTESINVSLEGVSFFSRLDLALGYSVIVSVPGKCRLNGQVIWVGNPDGEGLREIGVQLLPPLTDWVIK